MIVFCQGNMAITCVTNTFLLCCTKMFYPLKVDSIPHICNLKHYDLFFRCLVEVYLNKRATFSLTYDLYHACPEGCATASITYSSYNSPEKTLIPQITLPRPAYCQKAYSYQRSLMENFGETKKQKEYINYDFEE